MFDGTPFTPKFGLAVEADPDLYPDGVVVFLSTLELDCTNYEDVVFGSTPGYGVAIFLPSTSPGTYGPPDAEISVFENWDGGFRSSTGPNSSATTSKGDADRVAGSVTLSIQLNVDAEVMTSVEGTFDVVRCFE